MLKDDDGTLYIGGDWDENIGDFEYTRNLAKFGVGATGWQPIIPGVDPPIGTVYSMLKDDDGNTLYIGGSWDKIGNVEDTQNLAKYVIGKSGWQPIIKGVVPPNGIVNSIVKDGNTLYIGGEWDEKLGDVEYTRNLAKLNSTTVSNNNTSYLINNIGDTLKFICRDNNYIKVNNI